MCDCASCLTSVCLSPIVKQSDTGPISYGGLEGSWAEAFFFDVIKSAVKLDYGDGCTALAL